MKYIIMIICICLNLFASDKIETKGTVYINDKKVHKNMKVNLDDFVKTGKNSQIKFNIGQDAFKAKENTRFVITQKRDGTKELNIVTGEIIGAFKTGSKYNIKSENMTAGIRGTGVYVNVDNGRTYYCTCYGETEVETAKTHKNLHATHHNMIWVRKNGSVLAAKTMLNHNDNDLREVERFVGRVPNFDE